MSCFRGGARVALMAATVALAAAPNSASAQDFDAVEIQAQDLGNGLYMLTGAGGNIGVSAGPDGVMLIDDQFAPLTEKIVAAVAAISGEPIRFIINTHWHADHTGGNENLGRAGAVIVAHDNVRERMSVEQFMEAYGRRFPAAPAIARPVITFDETITFHTNGQQVRVFHVDPAHTDGDSIVHFTPADVFHMGDTYFRGRYPFIDISSGGSVEGVIAAADRVLALASPNAQIIPGHGALSNRSELGAFRDMVVAVRDSVAAAIADGESLDDVIASHPTAAFDAAFGDGFVKPDDFVRFAYQSLDR